MALGYGNFDTVIQYDVYSMAEIFMRDAGNWSLSKFKSSDFYLNVDLGDWLSSIFGKALDSVSTYFTSFPSARDRSAKGFYNYCLSSQSYVDVFVCDSYKN